MSRKKDIFFKLLSLLVVFGAVLPGIELSFIGRASAATPLKSMPNISFADQFDGPCIAANLTVENCGILNIIVTSIRILSVVFGVIVVVIIAVGGIQYATARDNPQAVAAAKQRIVNALIALVFYLILFAFLQWLVPGGVL